MTMDLIEQAARRLEQLRSAGVSFADPRPARDPVANPQSAANLVPSAPPPPPPAPVSRAIEINLPALTAAGFLTPIASRSKIADEYRVIKRPLIANALGKGASPLPFGNLIMVTSALSGEGKTFTSVNLAMSIATELDTTVMLVDADVARPSVLATLGLQPSRGLLDVLLDDAVSLPDVLLRTNVEKLTLLPSGTPHPRATELLASDAMNALLTDISTRYSDRIVIFDSPPLLLTTEARTLAEHMGQIVVVVQAARTTREDVRQALATIEECPVKMLVLNQARNEGLDTAYGYGYGYAT
jgi:exopolysaccharide/PEP-CTERM locus tyrosine autokinase